MKSLAFVLFALVGSLILTNLPTQSYADPNLDTLLRIATQARDNINIQLSQLPTVPDEISQLYKQGSEETDALTQSVSQNDQASSREHFLSAMKIFKEINDKISSLTPAATSEQPTQTDTSQVTSEINRIQMLGDKLETIAIKNNVEIDFSKFNETMQNARQNLDAGNTTQVNKDLDTANQFLLDVHQLLADAAKMKTSERAKDFTEKQIQRLSQIQESNPPQNVTQSSNPPQNVTQSSAPLTTPLPVITNANPIEGIPDMIVKLKQLVSEGKIDEALKLIKLIETLQNHEINSHTSITETLNATQPDNVNDVNTTEITNPVINATVTNQNNQTQSDTTNHVNTTQNSNIINNPPHIDNENKFHEKKDNQTQSQNSVNATKNTNSTMNTNAVNNIPHFDNEKKTHENRNNQTQSWTVNHVNATQNVNTVNNTQHHIDNKKSHKDANLENKDKKKIKINNSED